MSSYKAVFPDSSVKQVFEEQSLKRQDDMVIECFQVYLISQSVSILLKPSILSCLVSNRKYIQEKDLDIAISLCPFCLKDKPHDAGSLFNASAFEKMVNIHIVYLSNYLSKNGIDISDTIKISSENSIYLQRYIEKIVRGFISEMKKKRCDTNYNVFMITMRSILGDPIYGSLEHEFSL